MSPIVVRPEALIGLILLGIPAILFMHTLSAFVFFFGVPFSGALTGVWLRMRSDEKKRQQATRLRLLRSGINGVIGAVIFWLFSYGILEGGPSTRTAAMIPDFALLWIVSGLLTASGVTLVMHGVNRGNHSNV